MECVSSSSVLTEKVQKEVKPLLVFTSLQGERRTIYVVGEDGTGLRKVAGGRSKAIWPTWSPDGRQLGYLSDRDGNWEIYVTTSEGRGTKRLTKTPADETGPAWSPNKLDFWIAFIMKEEDEQLFIMRPDGTQRKQLTHMGGRKIAPSWSPDGTQIAFESNATGNWELYKVGLDEMDPVRLTDTQVNNETPVWSPIISGGPCGKEKAGSSDAPRTPAQPLAKPEGCFGQRIAFESERDGNWEIYVIDADGSNVKRITRTPGADTNPTWSPDGAWLAFDTIERGKGEIYVTNEDGSGLRNLTNDPSDDIGPQWSPDGSLLAFSSDRDGRYQIYVMDATGNHLRQVTELTGDNKWPFWSPRRVVSLE